MKNLKDILNNAILEKLKVDDILEKLSIDSIVPDKEEFPINKSVNDMIEFLIENDYKEIPYEKYWDDTITKFSNETGKCFMANDNNSEIFFLSFIDRSNTKLKNILFSIIKQYDKYQYNILDIKTAIGGDDAEYIDKNKFLNKVNKLF